MRYKYPRTRTRAADNTLRIILHTASFSHATSPQTEKLAVLEEFQREPGFIHWRTPIAANVTMQQALREVPSLCYLPSNPPAKSNFTVVMPYQGAEGQALGYQRWDDSVLDEIFGVMPASPQCESVQEALLALDAGEAVLGHLFVTANEDLLIHRDWLQDRIPVFIVSLAEALDFIDVHLKRKGIYAYRASSHVIGEQGYYFQRVCEAIPNLPPAWTTSLFGESELPNGQAVQKYLESFHLRLVSMFEAKDNVADQFYRLADNDTQYRMLRELNTFFPMATGSFDALSWLSKHLYGFQPGKTEDDKDFRQKVIFKLSNRQSTNGLINHIEQANKALGALLRSDTVQKLMDVFYPARDSIQHRHPLAGVQYTWVEDRGLGITVNKANEKAYSLAILDEDTAQAIGSLDQNDNSDYFSQWGIRVSGSTKLLEPYKFVTKALMELCEFYDEFFKNLGLALHPSLSDATKQSVQSVEKERKEHPWQAFATPFFLERDIPMIFGGLAQVTGLKPGYSAGSKASDKRSQALYGSHALMIDIARIEKKH